MGRFKGYASRITFQDLVEHVGETVYFVLDWKYTKNAWGDSFEEYFLNKEDALLYGEMNSRPIDPSTGLFAVCEAVIKGDEDYAYYDGFNTLVTYKDIRKE